MKRIGLIAVDSNFPNFALMKISACHKSHGDHVEWADNSKQYDLIYQSKIFSFTPDVLNEWDCPTIKGGTGYDIKSKLEDDIEKSTLMDYSIYPNFPFSIQFFSRGCIRDCPFCLVRDKEGNIHPVKPVELNPNGEWIEVLDNNFFANPEWKEAINYLIDKKQQVNLHGVDVRIMNEEQAFWLNKVKLRKHIHIAWDLPEIDLTEKLKEVIKYINPNKLMCYVLVGFNSSMEEDLYRIYRLRELGIRPFVMPYKDFQNKNSISSYTKDLARWVNNRFIFNTCPRFADYIPRKNLKCIEYFNSDWREEDLGIIIPERKRKLKGWLNEMPLDILSSEDNCKNYLKQLREKHGIICPKCGNQHHYWKGFKNGWECTQCKYRTSLTSGTIMHKTKLPLKYWFYSLNQLYYNPKISSLELQRRLGHNRYEPIWHIVNKLHEAIEKSDEGKNPLIF